MISDNSENFPFNQPFAAVCKITSPRSSGNLSLNCGSMIIIDAENPPAPDKFSLSLKRDGSFAPGILNTAPTGNMLWGPPVSKSKICRCIDRTELDFFPDAGCTFEVVYPYHDDIFFARSQIFRFDFDDERFIPEDTEIDLFGFF